MRSLARLGFVRRLELDRTFHRACIEVRLYAVLQRELVAFTKFTFVSTKATPRLALLLDLRYLGSAEVVPCGAYFGWLLASLQGVQQACGNANKDIKISVKRILQTSLLLQDLR